MSSLKLASRCNTEQMDRRQNSVNEQKQTNINAQGTNCP